MWYVCSAGLWGRAVQLWSHEASVPVQGGRAHGMRVLRPGLGCFSRREDPPPPPAPLLPHSPACVLRPASTAFGPCAQGCT